MEVLLLEALRPFVVLAGFILVLLVFELLLMLVGLSSTVEFDGLAPDSSDGFLAEQGAALPLDPQELAMLETPLDIQPMAAKPSRRVMTLLGLGRGPILIWMTCMAAGLSILGFAVQFFWQGATGAMLSASLALALVVLPGIWLGRVFSDWVARLVPSFESHAISAKTFHGRRGTVVIGTARRGEPAQVRWQDLYGTVHSLMAEPLRDQDSLTAGTLVLIVKTRDRQPRLVALD